MTTKKMAEQFEEVTESTELAPTVNLEQVMSKDGSLLNTMNLATTEGKVQTINALNNAISLKEAKDTVLNICDCITMPGIRKGRGGAPDTECINTYLIDTEGNAWFSQSDGINRSVRMIAMMFPDFGKSTKEGSLPMHVDAKELANGNTIKSLVLDL